MTEHQHLAQNIMAAARQIASSSLAIKPFIRFSKEGITEQESKQWWDFDHLLQQQLLQFLLEIAAPDEIVQLGLERYKTNLEDLVHKRRAALTHAIQTGEGYASFNAIDTLHQPAFDWMKPGQRLLYIGAGSGTECFQIANHGLDVIGIDINVGLLNVAREWADYLGRSTAFIAMDVIAPGFKAHSFDGFILEFYGYLPHPAQISRLQQRLARLLKPDGRGLITGLRRKYSSYWPLMTNFSFPPLMVHWLAPQSALDLYFSTPDQAEAQLINGIYQHTHTVKTLAAELAHTFDILSCHYVDDPRYIRAMVKAKPPHQWQTCPQVDDIQPAISDERYAAIQYTLGLVEDLLRLLDEHTQLTSDYFSTLTNADRLQCFKHLKPDLRGMIQLLNQINPTGPFH